MSRGQEPSDSDPYIQLEHIESRIQACIDVIRYVKEETLKAGTQVKKSKREKELESVQLRLGSASTSSDDEPDKPADANESHQRAQETAGPQSRVRTSQPKVRKKSFLPPLDPSRTSLTGKVKEKLKVAAAASNESSASLHSTNSIVKHLESRDHTRVVKDKCENKSKNRSNTRRPMKKLPKDRDTDTDTDTDDTMDKMDSKRDFVKRKSISITELDKTMIQQIRRELEEKLACRLRDYARTRQKGEQVVDGTTHKEEKEFSRTERKQMVDIIKSRKREIEEILYTKPEILLQRCSKQEVKGIDWWRRSRLNQLHGQRSIFLEKPTVRQNKSLKKPQPSLSKPSLPARYTMSRKYIKLHYLDILANVDIRHRNHLLTEQVTLT